METLGLVLFVVAVASMAYAFVVFPFTLGVLARLKPAQVFPDPVVWPSLTITLPVYNEDGRIQAKLEELLALDYPRDRYRILVISDASSDRTDEIVSRYTDKNVQLIRLSERGGKTAAENFARQHLWGDLVVNTDASVRVPPESLKALVRPFVDSSVGVTTSRNVNIGRDVETMTLGEAWYTQGDMWMRLHESRLVSVIGASGAFYASRRDLHQIIAPEALSRDFLAPLIAWEHGFRSVFASDAICLVPRTASIQAEFRRKVRTMTRGLQTLFYKKHLMNPIKHGLFAWILFSHKLARWFMPLALVGTVMSLALVATTQNWARIGLLMMFVAVTPSVLVWRWPPDRPMPVVLSAWGFFVSVIVAGVVAWVRALQGDMNPTWEPTRRTTHSHGDTTHNAETGVQP